MRCSIAIVLAVFACTTEPLRLEGRDPESGVDASTADAAPSTERWLSETGLYESISEKEINPRAVEYEPRYPLWSDGAEKRRWLLLPEGERVNTSNMESWQLPVGGKLFKEFSVNGQLVETRMIHRTGSRPFDYWMGAFVWASDGSDAQFAPGGAVDAGGTSHDVPPVNSCWTCHEGMVGKILGFSAVQLSHDGNANLLDLAQAGLFSRAPARPYPAPGTSVEAAAFGVLHANCGTCHNPQGTAFEDVSLDLLLRAADSDRSAASTQLYETSVGVELERFEVPPFEYRVVPGDPDASGVVHRMSVREATMVPMPPIASDRVDEDGVAKVRSWIEAL